MRRRLFATALLAFLAASAGCTAFGPGPVDENRLTKDVTYDWDVDTNATITIERGRYKGVYRIHNRTQFEAYRFQRFGDRAPVDPIGLQFRYPNGTILTLDNGSVTKKRSRTVIDLPASNGTLAFAVSKEGKRVTIPAFVEGSYEVVLPPNTDVKYPLVSHVVPGDYERRKTGSIVRLHWEDVERNRISVRYYLLRDLLLLGGLLAIAGVLVVVGSVHFWLQIRSLRQRREAVDLDVEGDDGSP